MTIEINEQLDIELQIYCSEHATECMSCGNVTIPDLKARQNFDEEELRWLRENASTPHLDEDKWLLPKRKISSSTYDTMMRVGRLGQNFIPKCRDCRNVRRGSASVKLSTANQSRRALLILHRLSLENERPWWAFWRRRWFYSAEPLRNDAARLLDEIDFDAPLEAGTKRVEP